MPHPAPQLNALPSAPPVLHVLGVDAHVGFVGAGHKVVFSDRQVHADKVFRFVLSPAHLKQEIEKLVAAAKQLGIRFDENYRALETVPYANGHDRGHTKGLPVLPLKEDGPDLEPHRATFSDRHTSLAQFSAEPAPARINGHNPAHSQVRLSDAQIDEAYRDYITSGDTLNQVGDRHGFSGGALSARLIARYGRGYAIRARRAQQNGPAAVAALLASAGLPEETPAFKPSGALL